MPLTADQARGLHLGILIVLCSAWVVLLISLWGPGTALAPLASLLTACPFRALGGEPCPLCGAASAAGLALSGRLSEGLGINPLGPALIPIGVAQLAFRTCYLWQSIFCWRAELVLAGGSAALIVTAFGA